MVYFPSVAVSNKGICCDSIAKWYQRMFNEITLLIQEKYKEAKILKELIDELDSLIDLTDNFIDDDDVAPIRVCGIRWIGNLVKVVQRGINKFGIYLTDLENFSKKGKKQKIKAEMLADVSRWRNYWYLLAMGFFLQLLILLRELSLGWHKKIVTVVDQERRLKKVLKHLFMLKTICDNDKFLEQNIWQNSSSTYKWWWLFSKFQI